jgi:hypothetical protein
VHLSADLIEAGELRDQRPGHVHHVEDTLGADDQRLRNPLHPFEGGEEDAVELRRLRVALPARSRGRQLHHAIIGEDAEHHLHLRLEHILGERLEQDLLRVNVDQPGAPHGIVALRRHAPRDRFALEARIAEQLCNRICAHCRSFPQPPPRRRSAAHECEA